MVIGVSWGLEGGLGGVGRVVWRGFWLLHGGFEGAGRDFGGVEGLAVVGV